MSPNPMKLLLTPRTLFASGFDAATQPLVVHKPADGVWTWTAATEDELRKIYTRVVRHPATCDADRVLWVRKPAWGLASRIRDFGDFLLRGLATGKAVVHAVSSVPVVPGRTKGTTNASNVGCPWNEEMMAGGVVPQDPFMLCVFPVFSSCAWRLGRDDVATKILHAGATRDPFTRDTIRFGKAVRPLWSVLQRRGLRWAPFDSEADGGNRSGPVRVSGTRQLGVLRALLTRVAFSRLSNLVHDRLQALEHAILGQVHYPMAVVHIRRTDIGDDVEDDQKLLPHERMSARAAGRRATQVVRALLAAAERMGGKAFGSVFVMADSVDFLPSPGQGGGDDGENGLYRRDDGPSRNPDPAPAPGRVVVVNPAARHMLSGLAGAGHRKMGVAAHESMNVELMASVAFAQQHGRYLVGNGKSGVSQLIAQGIGGRLRVDPNEIALFEDDPVVLDALPETRGWWRGEEGG